MFIAGLYVVIFPFGILHLVSRPSKFVKSKTFNKKYGTLTEDVFKNRTMYQKAYYVLFLFNRLVLTLTLVYLYFHPFYQMCILMLSQVLMIAYLIKFRPFKSELQQVIAVSDEFILVIGIVLLYFLWQNQDNLEKSNKIGMGIIGIIVLSLIKNMGVIIFMSTISLYKKFRAWAHKKLGMEKHLRRQRRLELRNRREKVNQEKHEKELINKIFIGRLRPEQILAPGQPSIKSKMRKVERPKPKLNDKTISKSPKDPISIINDQLVSEPKSLKRINSASGSKRNKFRRRITLANNIRDKVGQLETIKEEEQFDDVKMAQNISRLRSR